MATAIKSKSFVSKELIQRQKYSFYQSISTFPYSTSKSFKFWNNSSLKSSLSCPLLFMPSLEDSFVEFGFQPFCQQRNNSDSDTVLRMDLIPHSSCEINTLSESFEKLSDNPEIFQTLHTFSAFQTSDQNLIETQDTRRNLLPTSNKSSNSAKEYSPLTISDSSLSTSNSDFFDSSTEQHESLYSNMNKKPKEGVSIFSRFTI